MSGKVGGMELLGMSSSCSVCQTVAWLVKQVGEFAEFCQFGFPIEIGENYFFVVKFVE